MSYIEYIDLFDIAQTKDCPYRAFMIDVVDSKKQPQYIIDYIKHHNFLDYIFNLLKKEEVNGMQIVLNDNNNQHKGVFESKGINGNLCNPMILGDMATYFLYNNSITVERIIEIILLAINEFDINYAFHFATGVYETNDYGEGGSLLFKGYMPQILENMSKKNEIILTKDNALNDNMFEK